MTEGLPKIYTPEEVAIHFGWSPRAVRRTAREIGACRIFNKRMVMTSEDVDRLLAYTRPTPKPEKAPPASSARARSSDGSQVEIARQRLGEIKAQRKADQLRKLERSLTKVEDQGP